MAGGADVRVRGVDRADREPLRVRPARLPLRPARDHPQGRGLPSPTDSQLKV